MLAISRNPFLSPILVVAATPAGTVIIPQKTAKLRSRLFPSHLNRKVGTANLARLTADARLFFGCYRCAEIICFKYFLRAIMNAEPALLAPFPVDFNCKCHYFAPLLPDACGHTDALFISDVKCLFVEFADLSGKSVHHGVLDSFSGCKINKTRDDAECNYIGSSDLSQAIFCIAADGIIQTVNSRYGRRFT